MWWSIASSSSPCECVCYHQSSMCNCVTRKSPESRSIGVSSPLFKIQCCQRSRRCQHGTLSHHRTADGTPGWWWRRYVIPASPASVHREKNTNHLELCNGYKRKTSVANCERKNTSLRDERELALECLCAGAKFRFRLFRFLLLWWLRTWTWTQQQRWWRRAVPNFATNTRFCRNKRTRMGVSEWVSK